MMNILAETFRIVTLTDVRPDHSDAESKRRARAAADVENRWFWQGRRSQPGLDL